MRASQSPQRRILFCIFLETIRETRSSTRHIEIMDLSRLLDLWQQHYDRIGETGKMLLPLVKVFFLAPPDEE